MAKPSREAALQSLCNQALQAHHAGAFEDAKALYNKVILRDPKHFDALYLLGTLSLQTGDTEQGVSLIKRAVRVNPSAAETHCMLGVGLNSLQRREEALASYDAAIRLKPAYAEAHFNRALTLGALERRDEALASYDRAIALRPDYAKAHVNRGLMLCELKRPEEALTSLKTAIALNPYLAEAHYNMGQALRDLKRPSDALASFDRAIALMPDHAEAHQERGLVLGELKRPEEALSSFDKAIALKPDFADAHNDRSGVLNDLKRYDEALASADRALAIAPDYAEAHHNRGCALFPLNRLDEALASFDRAVAASPDSAQPHNGRGWALHALGRVDEALACAEKAIALDPDFTAARLNRCFTLLLMGQLEDGFRDHELRPSDWGKTALAPSSARPWLGERDVGDKILLAYYEQGLGDIIQFSRYISRASELFGQVIFSVPADLGQLLEGIAPNVQTMVGNSRPEKFDYYCSILSFPFIFRTNLESIPSWPRYLSANEERRARFSARLGPKTKARIGLVWSGNPDHHNDHNRSIPFAQVEPLISDEVHWITPQKIIRPSDEGRFRACGRVEFYGDELRDFSDTAALVDLLDLVITVDTSVAHLAGAMGKPVWLLLPYVPDWRWLLGRRDSPWYPTAVLYRQPKIGDWASVIDEVKADLRTVTATTA